MQTCDHKNFLGEGQECLMNLYKCKVFVLICGGLMN